MTCAVTWRSLATFITSLVVVAAEGANQTLDYFNYGMRQTDSLSDIGKTLFWPFVIAFCSPHPPHGPSRLADP